MLKTQPLPLRNTDCLNSTVSSFYRTVTLGNNIILDKEIKKNDIKNYQ